MDDIAHVIQLAVTPVFLLTGIGALLNALVSRLGRAVDRRRALTAVAPTLAAPLARLAEGELAYVRRRIRIIYAAIALSVMAELLVCLLIAVAFLDALTAAHLARLVAVLFVLSMLSLIGSLALFLREIYLGVNTIACPVR